MDHQEMVNILDAALAIAADFGSSPPSATKHSTDRLFPTKDGKSS
jgi:hypothetical protein